MTRVMVVDDEVDTLNLLRTILEISGYETVSTQNPMEALYMAQLHRPDVILLDIMMPGLDGFTLCKMIRLNPATVNVPVLFITAYSSSDAQARCVEVGGDMVLPKPLSMQLLQEAIEFALSLADAGIVAKPRPGTVPPAPPRMPEASPLQTGALPTSPPKPSDDEPPSIDIHPDDAKP